MHRDNICGQFNSDSDELSVSYGSDSSEVKWIEKIGSRCVHLWPEEIISSNWSWFPNVCQVKCGGLNCLANCSYLLCNLPHCCHPRNLISLLKSAPTSSLFPERIRGAPHAHITKIWNWTGHKTSLWIYNYYQSQKNRKSLYYFQRSGGCMYLPIFPQKLLPSAYPLQYLPKWLLK